jgi:hypothetical protein
MFGGVMVHFSLDVDIDRAVFGTMVDFIVMVYTV